MSALAELISCGESALVSRILHYAEKMGYTKFAPTDEAVWRLAVRGFSEGLVAALSRSVEIPEISIDIDFMNDRISAFGVEQAKKHRSRGVTLEMFLGLMKYVRQGYHDLIDDSDFDRPEARWAHNFIERYFNRIELGFISEWERSADALKAHHEKLLLDRNAALTGINAQLKLEIVEKKRAEQKIKKLNAELERRVAVRTLQLQRIIELDNYKLKELLILNRLSSLDLSKIRLNRLSCIILTALTSNAPLFFDRAMLFLLNERTQVLQGMLGVMRKNSACGVTEYGADARPTGAGVDTIDDPDSPLNTELRTCRVELKKGKGAFYRAVNENKVVIFKPLQASDQQHQEIFERLNIGLAAVMPLMGKNGIFGLVVIDNPHSKKEISRNDLKFLQIFSNHASIAIENLMLYTSLEEAHRRLQEAQEQLVHGERLATIGEMAASIAHELKGPLVAIGGFARRLAKKIPPDSSEAGYVATIIDEELRLEGMIDEVLSFSKKTTICYERNSITDIVESALSILSHIFEKNGVTLAKSFPRHEIMLYADCQQLKQVFINLVHNALDVMRNGGVLRVAISSAKIDKERAVAVRISDTGGGVSESLRNNIFTPFFTTKSSGTGLGLPIANRIVSNHNGKLKVRNNSAGGAEFTVLLPCHD